MHTNMRTRPPEGAQSRWLPLEEVAPIPQMRTRPGHCDPATLAEAEVAATVALPAPAAVVRRQRRSAAEWRPVTVVILAALMVLGGGAGYVSLRSHTGTTRLAQSAIAVPGTGLVVDKPAGWTEAPVEAAPAVLAGLVGPDRVGYGVFFTGSGGRVLFVVDVPNSADLDAVPPVPDFIGPAIVSYQAEAPHDLGPARRIVASSRGTGPGFGLEATYILTEGRIVVVGAFAEGTLDTATSATADALVASLQPRDRALVPSGGAPGPA